MKAQYPILEFDHDRQAVIEPEKIVRERDVPEHCVLCFFREVIERVTKDLRAEMLPPIKTEMGMMPLYRAEHGGEPFAVFPAPVGAPLAAGLLEEVIARGGRKFVLCGGAGVLDGDIASGDIALPISAVRDEGTSYHYLPPSREVAPTRA